jgi:hypothetical protein
VDPVGSEPWPVVGCCKYGMNLQVLAPWILLLLLLLLTTAGVEYRQDLSTSKLVF